MKDLFIQFYTRGKYLIDGNVEHVPRELGSAADLAAINNGFSYISDVVDPVWVEVTKSTKWGPIEMPELPDRADNIYVSVWYQSQFLIVGRWAKTNPECKFFVGGPITAMFRPEAPKALKVNTPSNLCIMSGRAESIINKEVDAKSWKLQLPNISETPLYSYYFGNRCYWNKCTFCNKTFGEDGSVDIEPLHNAPPGIVFLSTPAARPDQLSLFHKFPTNNKRYWVMIRGDKKTLVALKKELPFEEPGKIMFALGVEFPSNRMLRFMNKGTTVETLVETITLLADHGHSLRLFYIVGWPNLIKEDVESAKRFFDSITDRTGNNQLHRYGSLVVYNPEEFPKHWTYDEYGGKYFLMGYRPRLDDCAAGLNNEVINAMQSRFEFIGLRQSGPLMKANSNTLVYGQGTSKQLKYITPDYGRDVLFLSGSEDKENESIAN